MTTSSTAATPADASLSAASRTTEVVVVGGGIGGLAAAFALRTIGCAVTLLERAPAFGEVGAGVQIAPNASRILQHWGLLNQMLATGVRPSHLVFRDALTDETLTQQDLSGDFLDRYDAPYFVIHRSDLHAVLLAACRRVGVDLRTDHHVDDVHTDDDGATVRCANGVELHGDLVVAADGLASRLRDRIVGDQPVPSGYVAYRGTFPVAEVPDAATLGDVVVWIGPGCHFVQYPLRQGEMINQVAVFRSPSFEHGNPDWGGPDELDAAFLHCSPSIQKLLPFLWRDKRWQMTDRNPAQRWIDGRTVLLGDAAHPPLQYLAQGACMAIEDAAFLANSINTSRQEGSTQWASALQTYETERAPRTARIQTTARMWGDIWHVDGMARMLRNELFQRRDINDFRYLDWLYGYRI